MRIAVMGDLHYPALEEGSAHIAEDRDVFYARFLEQFFSIPADLYVSIGDLTNFGWRHEFEEVYAIISDHQKPFVQVLGNHDAYAMPRREVLAATGQPRFQLIETDTAALAFLDTAREQDFTDWGGTLDAKQLEWLETTVANTSDKPLIVFGHHPVHGTTANSTRDKRSIPPNIPVWDILSKKAGSGLYVNGHNHVNSTAAREQWHFLQIAAVLDEQAVRLIEISEDSITIDFIDLHDAELNKRAETIGNAISHFELKREQAVEAAGTNHVIPLLKQLSAGGKNLEK